MSIEPTPVRGVDLTTLQEHMIGQDELIAELKDRVAHGEKECERLQTKVNVMNDEMLRATGAFNQRIQDLMVENHRLRKNQNDTPRLSPFRTDQETSGTDDVILQSRNSIDRLTEKSNKQAEELRAVRRENDRLNILQENHDGAIENLKSAHDPLMMYMEEHLEEVRSWLIQWKAGEFEQDGCEDPEGDAKEWFGSTFYWYPID